MVLTNRYLHNYLGKFLSITFIIFCYFTLLNIAYLDSLSVFSTLIIVKSILYSIIASIACLCLIQIKINFKILAILPYLLMFSLAIIIYLGDKNLLKLVVYMLTIIFIYFKFTRDISKADLILVSSIYIFIINISIDYLLHFYFKNPIQLINPFSMNDSIYVIIITYLIGTNFAFGASEYKSKRFLKVELVPIFILNIFYWLASKNSIEIKALFTSLMFVLLFYKYFYKNLIDIDDLNKSK